MTLGLKQVPALVLIDINSHTTLKKKKNYASLVSNVVLLDLDKTNPFSNLSISILDFKHFGMELYPIIVFKVLHPLYGGM